uniref:Uncharacterized protein n=1 Tax=Oryza rufipogon TaxID=4529 RepID=A0A0E0QKN8_ORYRU
MGSVAGKPAAGWGIPAATAAAASASLASSRGTMSTRKSKTSVRAMAAAMSDFWSVRRLFSSACAQPRWVSSRMNISHALANTTGASAAIMRTSSSAFMIFLMRARGRLWFLKSVVCSISRYCSAQKFWSCAAAACCEAAVAAAEAEASAAAAMADRG